MYHFFSLVLELFHYSLSLSHSWTLRIFLKHFGIRSRKENKVRGSKKGRAGSSNYNNIICRYQFSCVFSLLYLACMVLHVLLCCYGMGFSKFDIVFCLAFPFPDNYRVMGFSCFGWDRMLNGFEAKGGKSPNDRTHGLVTHEPDCGLW